MINACAQSGRNVVPTVEPICSFTQALQMSNNPLNLLLHPGGLAQKLTQLVREEAATTAVSLWIGPEGGFSEEEVKLAQAGGFRLASLGPRILRMETAAISSITLLQALLGDI